MIIAVQLVSGLSSKPISRISIVYESGQTVSYLPQLSSVHLRNTSFPLAVPSVETGIILVGIRG